MTIIDWLLLYFLIGFVISWVGSNDYKPPIKSAEWHLELLGVLLWPVVMTLVVVGVCRGERLRRIRR